MSSATMRLSLSRNKLTFCTTANDSASTSMRSPLCTRNLPGTSVTPYTDRQTDRPTRHLGHTLHRQTDRQTDRPTRHLGHTLDTQTQTVMLILGLGLKAKFCGLGLGLGWPWPWP